ncbi:hypothetical protein K1719_039389, partial [Acacia pycnantha]
EMDRQVPLMDEIDTKVDKASSDLKNTNVDLKTRSCGVLSVYTTRSWDFMSVKPDIVNGILSESA